MPEDNDRLGDGDATESSRQGSTRLPRRRMLQVAGGATVTALSGCLDGSGSEDSTDTPEETDGDDQQTDTTTGDASTEASFEGETLRVATWSGSYGESFEETVVQAYEEETGANIELSLVWSETLSKIRAAPEDNPPYDIAVTDGYFYYMGQQEGLFNAVEYDNVPNIENVYPYLREFWTTEYGVPTGGAPLAIINSTEADAQPQEWSEFAESQSLGVEGGWWVYPAHIAAIASDESEDVSELYDESTHDHVWETLDQFDVEVWYDSGAEVYEQFRQGLVDHSQGYYGTALAEAENDELNIEPALPEVTTGYFDHYCPVRGTDKQEMAEHFANFLLRQDMQQELANATNNLVAHQDVEYPDQVADDYPTSNEGYQSFHFPDWSYLTDYSSDFNQQFSAIKSQ